jgi:hypothetical protein
MRSGALDNVPISITVPRRRGHSIFPNHAPGHEPRLRANPVKGPEALGRIVDLPPRPPIAFHVFFIGNPYGAASPVSTLLTKLR